MNIQKIVLVVISAVALFLLFVFSSEVMSFVGEYFDKILSLVSVLLSAATIYYYRNEGFFVFIQKHLVLPLKHVHAKWKFTVHLQGCSAINSVGGADEGLIEKYKQEIRKLFDGWAPTYKIRRSGTNYLELAVGDEVFYRFEFEYEGHFEKLNINLTTSTFTVPFGIYQREIDRYATFFELLDRTCKTETTSYQLSSVFENGNPYAGFFIKNIPERFISQFNCSFRTPNVDGTSVKATKDTITIYSGQYTALRQFALKHIALSRK